MTCHIRKTRSEYYKCIVCHLIQEKVSIKTLFFVRINLSHSTILTIIQPLEIDPFTCAYIDTVNVHPQFRKDLLSVRKIRNPSVMTLPPWSGLKQSGVVQSLKVRILHLYHYCIQGGKALSTIKLKHVETDKK